MSSGPPLVLTGIGVLLQAGGLAAFRNLSTWRRGAVRTSGTVTRLESSLRSGASSYAWVRYATQDGSEVEGRTAFATRPAPAQPGQTVPILYRPDEAQRVRVDTVLGRGAVIFIAPLVIGTICLLIGIIGLLVS